jgi:hypothetical protein
MSESLTINLTDGAQTDLRWFNAYAQRIIIDGIELHLQHQPTLGTRRIIVMRPNPVASWELRLETFAFFMTWTMPHEL